MTRKLTFLILMLCSPLASWMTQAQQPWNFATLDEAYLGETYLIDPPAELHAKVTQSAGPNFLFNVQYHLSGPWTRWGKNYLKLQHDSLTFLLPESLATELLPYMVSTAYWQQRFKEQLQWTYIDMEQAQLLLDIDTSDHRHLRFSPLHWLGYTYQPSERWPVVFNVLTNTGHPQPLTQRAMERLAEWGSFATSEGQQAYAQKQATLDQEARTQRDELQAEIDSLSLIQNEAARTADSLIVALERDSLAEQQARLRAEVDRTKELMNSKELFFMSIRPAHSQHMFGLEFNLYNCFPKTITKVELTVTPYNQRGRVQEDKFHRSVRSVRCMGPIHPGMPAQYTFDELFWAEGDNIKYMRVTAVTFHFTDGTHRTFSGYERILAHTLNP